jgi:hypothetical protein
LWSTKDEQTSHLKSSTRSWLEDSRKWVRRLLELPLSQNRTRKQKETTTGVEKKRCSVEAFAAQQKTSRFENKERPSISTKNKNKEMTPVHCFLYRMCQRMVLELRDLILPHDSSERNRVSQTMVLAMQLLLSEGLRMGEGGSEDEKDLASFVRQ